MARLLAAHNHFFIGLSISDRLESEGSNGESNQKKKVSLIHSCDGVINNGDNAVVNALGAQSVIVCAQIKYDQ